MVNTKYQVIYKIRNLLNGKVYIGQSVDLYKRLKEHKYNFYKKKLHPLYNAINKYGIENFEFNVIEHVKDITKLDEKEQYWIAYYKSNSRDFGYNLRLDCRTNRGCKHTEEHKLKISNKLKAFYSDLIKRERLINLRKGKINSIIHRERMSEAQKGRKLSKERCIQRSTIAKKLWNKPEYRKKMSLVHTGNKHTEETKNKISLKMKEYRNNCIRNKESLGV